MNAVSSIRGAVRLAVLPGLLMLTGCASWFERDPTYPGAREVGRIEVPSGLVRPVSDPAMSIPPGQRGVLNRREVLPPDWNDEPR